jgi:hypothetical protein
MLESKCSVIASEDAATATAMAIEAVKRSDPEELKDRIYPQEELSLLQFFKGRLRNDAINQEMVARQSDEAAGVRGCRNKPGMIGAA